LEEDIAEWFEEASSTPFMGKRILLKIKRK